MVRIYAMAVKRPSSQPAGGAEDEHRSRALEDDAAAPSSGAEVAGGEEWSVGPAADSQLAELDPDQRDLLKLMQEAACMRDAGRTYAVVSTLVKHIVRSWRMHFAQSVAMKFNCFFSPSGKWRRP